MIRYTLRGLRYQWTSWIGTFTVLALAAALTYVCLAHRYTVTQPEVTAQARRLGVGPELLEMSGISVYVYSALVTIPVVAVVGRSAVQALRTTWAQWRLAGALPGETRATVIATIALVGVTATVPGLLLGTVAAQPVSSVLTRMAARQMGPITIHHDPLVMATALASVVLIAALGATGPAFHAARVPAAAALKDTLTSRARLGWGRWAVITFWAAVCAVQTSILFQVEPVPIPKALPGGGGQAMMLALLLGVLFVIAAPVLIPTLLRAWTAPLSRWGTIPSLARRSSIWRGEIAASAVALLALGLTFTTAMLTAVRTNAATASAVHLGATINQIDTYVLAAVMAAIATCGAIAIIAMTSRSREREFATLRCAGITPAQLRQQALLEPALYVITAMLLACIPAAITALGEAWFLTKAGLPFTPAIAWWQPLTLATLAYLILALTTLTPARRALRVPINTALAAE